MLEALEQEKEFGVRRKIDGEISKVVQFSGQKKVNPAKSFSKASALYDARDEVRRAANVHSWTRATASTIAKSAVGSGFSIVRHPVFGKRVSDEITEEEIYKKLEPLYDIFYGGTKKDFTHIQDFFTTSQKIYYFVISVVLYGQAGMHLIYDSDGNLTGFENLAGMIFPNVDEKGKFLNPSYTFRPWNSNETYSFKNPESILYVTWPGVDNSIYGNSEYFSAAQTAIPSDLYASNSYKNHFENMNAPYNGVWVVDENTSDEDFLAFLKLLSARYTGDQNFGRNPLIIKGQAEFKETRSRTNDDAPYLQGRQYNQEEISAVSGVPGSKMGISSQVAKSNFREMRREFHETALRPIYEIIEQAIYQQIFIRIFGIKEWMLAFNKPELTNALEDASIYGRYLINHVMTPNEVRDNLGMPPVDGGDIFFTPSSVVVAGMGDEVESIDRQSEDRNDEPDGGSPRQDDPVDVPSKDKPTVANEDKNFTVADLSEELKKFKKFSLRVVSSDRIPRPFYSDILPEKLLNSINDIVLTSDDKEDVRKIFDQLINELKEENDG